MAYCGTWSSLSHTLQCNTRGHSNCANFCVRKMFQPCNEFCLGASQYVVLKITCSLFWYICFGVSCQVMAVCEMSFRSQFHYSCKCSAFPDFEWIDSWSSEMCVFNCTSDWEFECDWEFHVNMYCGWSDQKIFCIFYANKKVTKTSGLIGAGEIKSYVQSCQPLRSGRNLSHPSWRYRAIAPTVKSLCQKCK